MTVTLAWQGATWGVEIGSRVSSRLMRTSRELVQVSNRLWFGTQGRLLVSNTRALRFVPLHATISHLSIVVSLFLAESKV